MVEQRENANRADTQRGRDRRDHLLRTIVIDARGTLARWNALRERWALTTDEEALLLGSPALEAASGQVPLLEQRAQMLIELGDALERLFVDDCRVQLWLRRPSSTTGGRSPLEAMSVSIEWIGTFRRAALHLAP